ncbi:MAG: hypothetical protein RTU30_08065 [Candidatus Thorarchaeota archaeon]
MESSNRLVLAVLVLVCVGIGVGFTMYYMSGAFTTTNNISSTTSTTPTSTNSTTPIEHTLEWGLSIGDTLVYQFYEEMYEGTADLGQVNLTITNLPDIPESITYSSFFANIFGKIQFDYVYTNESYVNENVYRYYASRAILPIGDWEFFDSLFLDSDEVRLPTTTSYPNDIFYGEISGESFIFGYRGYEMDADTGMRFTYNMTNGLATGFYSFTDHDWAYYSTSGDLIAYTPTEE